jgi:hypothetical protein
MKRLGQVLGITFLSQVVALLNAAFSPFRGTILAFDDWEPLASKTAVAAGFVIVAAVVALNLGATRSVLTHRTIVSVILMVMLLIVCIAIYFLLKSGFAPSAGFLFFVRDMLWMVVYILTLVTVGITIAFVQLLLFFGGSETGHGGRTGRTRPPRPQKKTAAGSGT